tara:strand:+ start:133 stop:552 length:420 start_codon:yes stop_codon:yes gene_type:complete
MALEILQNLRGDQLEYVSDKTSLSAEMGEKIAVSTHCFVGMADGKIAVIWGVLTPSITSGVGIVWAMTTKVTDEHPFVFVRHSRIAMEQIRKDYSELVAYVAADYKRSIRWLRWLGFEVSAPRDFHGMKARVAKMKGMI